MPPRMSVEWLLQVATEIIMKNPMILYYNLKGEIAE